MSSPRLKEFIEGGRYTCWGGDVWCADALRMASYLKVTGYPFVGVLWRSGTTLKRLYAHEGCISAEELVNSITEHVQSVQQELQQQAARDESIEGERRLREEQNRAYEEALAADQRRAEAEQREAEEKSLAEAVKISVMEVRRTALAMCALLSQNRSGRWSWRGAVAAYLRQNHRSNRPAILVAQQKFDFIFQVLLSFWT